MSKPRLGIILSSLVERGGFVTIEQLAEVCGAGVRTIHRDLEQLERSLGLRGVRLERRRGSGVRLLDPLPPALAAASLGGGGVGEFEAADRPFLMLIFLIATPGWVKLSEIAHAFFLSDSSVSGALHQLEPLLPEGATLEKQKGVGVTLFGEERILRRTFLSIFPQFFPRFLPTSEHQDGGRLLKALRLQDAGPLLLKTIREIEESLGYRFSPVFFGLIYAYLYLVRRRLAEGYVCRNAPDFRFALSKQFREVAAAAGERAVGGLWAGALPEGEAELLGRLLGGSEPQTTPDLALGSRELHASEVDGVIERSLNRLEGQERAWLHDDRGLLDYLRVTILAVAHRVELGIHTFRHFISESTVPCRPESQILVEEFLSAFGETLNQNLPSAETERNRLLCHELEEASLALEARLSRRRRRRAAGMMVKVLCYEGLGMTAWLSALVREVLPPGARIDSGWSPQGTLDVGPWDLVVATYRVDTGEVPLLVIDTEASPDQIREAIRDAVQDAVDSRDRADRTTGELPPKPEGEERGLSLPTIMSVIRSFFVVDTHSQDGLLLSAVNALDQGDCDKKQLLSDFERRESYGALVFEDLGTKLLHCRSSAIPEPRAGVLRPAGQPPVLVLAAPRTAPPEQTGVLSELVVALSDEEGFAALLGKGDREQIQAALITIFSRRLA